MNIKDLDETAAGAELKEQQQLHRNEIKALKEEMNGKNSTHKK